MRFDVDFEARLPCIPNPLHLHCSFTLLSNPSHIIEAKMAKSSQPEMSEYEKQRQANIAERNKLLKDLALDARAAGLGPKPAQKPAPKSGSSKKKAPKPKVQQDIGPRRTSSRLQGIVADSEVAKRKAEEEYVATQEANRAKRQRQSGSLNMSDVVVRGESWNENDNILVDVISRGANPYQRTFGETEVKNTSDKELKSLREQMSGLELYDGFVPNDIKITDERIYSLGFHPTIDKPLIFAGDKLGSLGIFDGSQKAHSGVKQENGIKHESDEEDADDEENAKPVINTFKFHTRTISAFQFSTDNPSQLYTSSYDSSLRLLDLNKSVSTEIYGPSDISLDEPLSGVEIDPSSPNILYFARLDGHVGRTDIREPNSTSIFELSEKKIGGFSLHPGSPHFIATASLDRYLRIWDVRKLSGKVGTQLPALIGEHESRLSVSHAAFNSAGQVATASYDNTVKIHTFDGMGSWSPGRKIPESEMEPSTFVPHNNQTGRWVTM